MENMNYNNIRALLDCFIEGILIVDSENRMIINESFKKIFNIEHTETPNIFETLEEYGLVEVFKSNTSVEKAICINDRIVKAKKLIIEKFEQSIYSIMILTESENTEDSNFKINELKQSLEAMKDILDIAYQGIVLVDKDARIVKWNYEKLMGIKEKDVLGKPVEEVIKNTRLHVVVKTGKNELYDVQRIQGHDMIANRIPIIKDGKIVGAVGTVLFKDIKEVKDLAMKLKMLKSAVDKYKGVINKMYRARYTFENIITQNEKMLKLKNIVKKAV